MRISLTRKRGNDLNGLWRITFALVMAFSTFSYAQAQSATVSIRALSVSASEVPGSNTVALEATLSNSLGSQVEVPLNVSGNGIQTDDFVNLATGFDFPSGQTTAMVIVTIANDSLIEGTEIATASVEDVPDLVAVDSENGSVDFTIVDNDFASFSLTSGETEASEGSGLTSFKVALHLNSNTLAVPVEIDLAFANTGTATAVIAHSEDDLIPGQDVRAFPGQVTFQPLDREGDAHTIEIETYSDGLIEGGETATLDISSSNPAIQQGLSATHDITVIDTNLPVVQFSSPSTSLREDDPNATIGLTLSLGNDQLTVPVAFELLSASNATAIGNVPTAGGGNTTGSDYAVTPLTVEFPSTASDGATLNFSFDPLTDTLIEGNETTSFEVDLITSGFAAFTSPTAHALTLVDANSATVEFIQSSQTQTEGDPSTLIIARVNTGGGTLAVPVSFTIFDTEEGNAIAELGEPGRPIINEDPPSPNSIDLETTEISFFFPAGAGDLTERHIDLVTRADNLVEGTEFTEFGLLHSSGPATLGPQDRFQFNIVDEDNATFQFTSTDSVVAEGQLSQVITVRLETGGAFLARPLDLRIAANEETDTATGDIPADEPGRIQAEIVSFDYQISDPTAFFGIGSADLSTRQITFSTESDSLIEGTESASLSFDEVSGPATVGDNDVFQLEIPDSNTFVVQFTTPTTSISEGDPTASLGIQLDLGDDQLAIPLDFSLLASPSDTATSDLPVIGGRQGALIDSNDYLAGPATITFPANTATGTILNFNIDALDDDLVEGTENALLNLSLETSTVSNFTSPDAHPLAIADADQATVEFIQAAQTQTEGDPATLIIARVNTGGATLAVPVSFSIFDTEEGNAIAELGTPERPIINADPPSPDSIDLETTDIIFLFPANTGDLTERHINLVTRADNLVEGTEFTEFGLVHSSGPATLGPQDRFQFNIVDEDNATFQFASTGSVTAEGQANQIITIGLETGGAFLARPLDLLIAADEETDTATGDIGTDARLQIEIVAFDYQISDPTAFFGVGSADLSTRQIIFSTATDSLIEGTESASLFFDAVSGPATVADNNIFQLEIPDSNTFVAQFTTPTTTVGEGDPTASLGVQLELGDDQLAIPLDFSLLASLTDTATSDLPVIGRRQGVLVDSNDYVAGPGSITFPANTETGTILNFNIDAQDDDIVEGTENARLNLSLDTSTVSNFTAPDAHSLVVVDADQASIDFALSQPIVIAEDADPVEISIVLSTIGGTLATDVDVEVVDFGVGTAIGQFGPGEAPPVFVNADPPPLNSPDFEILDTQVTFAGGSGDQVVLRVILNPLTDHLVEGSESATLLLNITSGPASLGTVYLQTVTITDANSATVGFALDTETVNEGTMNHEIQLVLDTDGDFLAAPVQVFLADDETSTATGDIGVIGFRTPNAIELDDVFDFEIPLSFANFPPGSADQSIASFITTTFSDSLVEGSEFALLLIDEVSGPVSLSDNSAYELVIPDQNSFTIGFQGTETTLLEGSPQASVSIDVDFGDNELAIDLTLDLLGDISDTANGNLEQVGQEPGAEPATPFDFTATSSFIIESGAQGTVTAGYPVEALNDDLVEGQENATLTVALNHSDTFNFTPATSHSLIIQDADSATVEFQTTDLIEIAENDDPVTITAILNTGDSTLAENVQVSLVDLETGAAIGQFGDPELRDINIAADPPPLNSPDYDVPDFDFLFAAGSGTGATQSITVSPRTDHLIEGLEGASFGLNIDFGPASTGELDNRSLTISDDNAASVSFVAPAALVAEGTESHEIAFQLLTNGDFLAVPVAVTLAADEDSTAIGDIAIPINGINAETFDYGIAQATATFAAGSGDLTNANIVASVFTDPLVEGTEVGFLFVSQLVGPAVLGEISNYNLVIEDGNEFAIEFTTADTILDEGDPVSSVGVQLDLGENQLAVPLTFALLADISDSADGNLPVVGADQGLNVDFEGDYFVTPDPITFPAESPDQTIVSFDVEALDDDLIEGQESALLTLSINNPNISNFQSETPHPVVIRDADGAIVEFTVELPNSVSEDGDPINLVAILRTQGNSLARDIVVSIVDLETSSAIGDLGSDPEPLNINADPPPLDSFDFAIPNIQFVFEAGAADLSTDTLSLLPRTDLLVEGPETADLALNVESGPASIGELADHQVTIVDANSAQIAFDLNGGQFVEGDQNQEISISLVTGDAFLARPVEVFFSIDPEGTAQGIVETPQPGVALSPDFVVIPASLTFVAGSGNESSLIALANIASDTLIEGPETGLLNIDELAGPANIGDKSTFSLPIQDQNIATVGFVESTSSGSEDSEGDHQVALILETNGATLERAFTTLLLFEDISAVTDSDYLLPEAQSVEWPAESGDETIRSIAISLVDDTTLEPDETFEIQLGELPSSFNPSDLDTHTVTITDDDQSSLSLHALQPDASEDGTHPIIAIRLSQPASTDTQYRLIFAGQALSIGGAQDQTMEAGDQQIAFEFLIRDDDLVEGPEQFTVTLDSIIEGDPDIQIDPEAQVLTFTVIDNDSTEVTLTNQQDAAEDEQNGGYLVAFTKAVNTDINLLLAFDGTATPNVDYTQPNLEITVPAGDLTLQVPIPVLADNLNEPTETIEATLSGVELPDLPITLPTVATLMDILDDDATPVALADLGQNYTINEDNTLNLPNAIGVLANDTDEDDGDGPENLTAVLEGDEPSSARVFQLSADGAITYQPNPDFAGVDTFEYRASDGSNQSEATLVTLTVNPLNDAPRHSVPNGQSVLEEGLLIFSNTNDNPITVSDPDLGETDLLVTLSAQGSLSLGGTDGLEFSQGDGSQDSTMSFSASLPALNQALQGLQYQPTHGTSPDTISLSTNDQGQSGAGGPQATTSGISVNVIVLNTPPDLSLPEIGALEVIGTQGGATVSPGLTLTDENDSFLSSASVQITVNYQRTEDSLAATQSSGSIQTSFDRSSGTLTLEGPATLESYQSVLRSVVFANSSTTPDSQPRVVTFTAHDGRASSNSVNRNIAVRAPEFPPELSATDLADRTFIENGGSVGLIGGVNVSLGTAGAITQASVSIGSGFAANEDLLSAGSSTLTSQYSSQSGTLTFTGSGSAGDYASALSSVSYSNPSEAPTPGTRSLSFQVGDAVRSSNSLSVELTVVDVNDLPAIEAPSVDPIEFLQGSDDVSIFSELSISDADHNQLGAATIILGPGFDPLEDQLVAPSLPEGLSSAGFESQSGSMTIAGLASLTTYQSLIEAVAYRNEADFARERVLRVSVAVADPRAGTSNTIARTINLTGRSTPPEFVEVDDIAFPEDTESFRFQVQVRDDRTPVEQLEVGFEIQSEEPLFAENGISVSQEAGILTFTLIPLPDATGQAELTLMATDLQKLTGTTTLKITILPLNDPPRVALSPSSPLQFYDGSGPRQIFESLTIDDPDNKELLSATVQINGFVRIEDSFQFQGVSPIQVTFDQNNRQIVLIGKAPIQSYIQTLESILYQNLSHRPTQRDRTFSLIVQDGPQSVSKPVPMIIQVFDANLPPRGTNDRVSTGDNDFVTIPFIELLKNDSDPDGDALSISLFTDTTEQGAPIIMRSNSMTVRSPAPGSTDRFYYTLTDRNGGFASVQVTISR